MTRSDDRMAVFWDSERGREYRYDFAGLRLPPTVSAAFQRAFTVITGAYRSTSRQQMWGHIRGFARFLRRDSSGAAKALSHRNLLLRYKTYLLRLNVGTRVIRTRYNFARRLIEWLMANESDGPWRSAVLFQGSVYPRLRREARSEILSPKVLGHIVACCKREVDLIIRCFSVRERLEGGEDVSQLEAPGIRLQYLREVIALEANGIYRVRDLSRIHRSTLKNIGLRRVASYRALTIRNALPYYLLLIINTCGNPVGIRDITIDCLQPHPTDSLKRRIFWNKHRARREQAYDALVSGRYSVVRCVEDLLRLTRPLRPLTNAADAAILMITRTGRRAARISAQSLHDALKAFRREHDLPVFTFADLRAAAAGAIDEYGRSVNTVRKALQHKSARTSRTYLRARRSIDRRYEGVLQFQGQMVELAMTSKAHSAATAERSYETLAGMHCRDPLSGIAPGSTKNQSCLKWLECCRCPNAIVVRDDPRVIARIIRAAQSLRELRVRAATSADASQHFESAFLPTLHVIESQILSQISKRIQEKATAIASSLPALPLME